MTDSTKVCEKCGREYDPSVARYILCPECGGPLDNPGVLTPASEPTPSEDWRATISSLPRELQDILITRAESDARVIASVENANRLTERVERDVADARVAEAVTFAVREEREACARMCDTLATYRSHYDYVNEGLAPGECECDTHGGCIHSGARGCAEAIRAREDLTP